jgi:(p)ppGpp synthase/HD superfamily hydrolase
VTASLSAYADAWLVSHAVSIAASAHRGQRDKGGEPYVLHPLRLMMRAKTPHERMTAVLHDVVEDTEWTIEKLYEAGFPDEVLAALECLTKRRGEDYAAFVARAAGHPIAARVKLFDLEDNMDLKRLTAMTEKDHARVEKYVKARAFLLARGVRGD